MEYGRRRRGRGRTVPMQVHVQRPPKGSLFTSLCNFIIMSSLVIITYYMLEYHCQNCKRKGDVFNVTQSINDIAENLFIMKNSYNNLEQKIMNFSQELPKIQGQMDVLESLANTIKHNNNVMKARSYYNLRDNFNLEYQKANTTKLEKILVA